MRDAEKRAVTASPEDFANACLPESNWIGDEWKSRRASIAAMVKARDAAVYRVAYRQIGQAVQRHLESPSAVSRKLLAEFIYGILVLAAEPPK